MLVGRLELDLAADVGDAHAVAVVADALDDAREQVPLGLGVELAEAQRVEDRDRPRSHGDDVAQDPADAGRGALERLHRRGVVVALDLERDGDPVADVDHARVLARPLQDTLARRGQRGEQRPRMLVGAVLAPKQREHGELEVVGLTLEQLADALVLMVGEAQRAVQRLSRDGVQTLLRSRSLSIAACSIRPSRRMRPSTEPSTGSTACSGCGMRPATLPAALVTHAIDSSEPLGLRT